MAGIGKLRTLVNSPGVKRALADIGYEAEKALRVLIESGSADKINTAADIKKFFAPFKPSLRVRLEPAAKATGAAAGVGAAGGAGAGLYLGRDEKPSGLSEAINSPSAESEREDTQAPEDEYKQLRDELSAGPDRERKRQIQLRLRQLRSANPELSSSAPIGEAVSNTLSSVISDTKEWIEERRADDKAYTAALKAKKAKAPPKDWAGFPYRTEVTKDEVKPAEPKDTPDRVKDEVPSTENANQSFSSFRQMFADIARKYGEDKAEARELAEKKLDRQDWLEVGNMIANAGLNLWRGSVGLGPQAYKGNPLIERARDRIVRRLAAEMENINELVQAEQTGATLDARVTKDVTPDKRVAAIGAALDKLKTFGSSLDPDEFDEVSQILQQGGVLTSAGDLAVWSDAVERSDAADMDWWGGDFSSAELARALKGLMGIAEQESRPQSATEAWAKRKRQRGL